MDLHDYEQHKFAIAETLRSASTAVSAEERDWHARAEELFARLAEDRFNLAVVGQFNRGKTSLMNAIMGLDRLPIGIVPLTSVITTVAYGSKEKVVLHYEGRILTHEVSIQDLGRYVTQESNPGNVRRIKKAEVQLPAEILRRGFYFVDTPGLGSAILENTRTTEAFLPEADAFLLVTSYESPLSDEEMRFFRTTSASARRIFLALNKHDTVSAEERRTALAYVGEQLTSIFGDKSPRIFSVSARDGLEAKRSGDAARLDESGLPALEAELVDFLLTEKSNDFLLGMVDRTAQLLRDFPSPEMAPLVERIGTIGEAVVQESAGRRVRLSPGRVESEVKQLCGCEICTHIDEALWNFLRRFQFDLSIDREAQRRFAEEGGLCSFHAWQYEAIASPQGTCRGFPQLLDNLAAKLRAMVSTLGHPELEDIARHNCVMCAVHARAQADAISATVQRLTTDSRSLDALSAICLPHLAMLTGAIEDGALVRKLIEREATILERLSEDMKRYALKRDAVRSSLLTEEETAAAHRALLFLNGRRNVNASSHGHKPRRAPVAPPLGDSATGDGLNRSATAPQLVKAGVS